MREWLFLQCIPSIALIASICFILLLMYMHPFLHSFKKNNSSPKSWIFAICYSWCWVLRSSSLSHWVSWVTACSYSSFVCASSLFFLSPCSFFSSFSLLLSIVCHFLVMFSWLTSSLCWINYIYRYPSFHLNSLSSTSSLFLTCSSTAFTPPYYNTSTCALESLFAFLNYTTLNTLKAFTSTSCSE